MEKEVHSSYFQESTRKAVKKNVKWRESVMTNILLMLAPHLIYIHEVL